MNLSLYLIQVAMKKCIVGVIFLLGFLPIMAQDFVPTDAGSSVTFSIKNFGLNTGGSFKGLAGSIRFNAQSPEMGFFNVSVNANSIDTDNKSRDKHLRKEEYFHAEKYPTLSFISTKVVRSTVTGTYILYGKLTIKAVTRDVSFPFTAIDKGNGWLFTGEYKINRLDYGVGGSSAFLGDNLKISLKVFALKK